MDLLRDSPSWWWPNHGDFEAVIGAILTQNTKWTNVQKSLQNLQSSNLLIFNQNEENLYRLSKSNPSHLAQLITSSGFANQKATRLIKLAQNILKDFGSYHAFTQETDGQWLISQKGIGPETRDTILNYACLRDIMVIDQYTYRLLCLYGYEMQDYEEIQNWITQTICNHFDKIQNLYPFEISLAQLYARFHGKIVEFAKKGFKA
ncbi:3-methyladenine DNA glycosylase [Helicobacter sp. faydin-H23]|nr:3-methyladenine DNA glycosylase [Helicobacter kayseriensis]